MDFFVWQDGWGGKRHGFMGRVAAPHHGNSVTAPRSAAPCASTCGGKSPTAGRPAAALLYLKGQGGADGAKGRVASLFSGVLIGAVGNLEFIMFRILLARAMLSTPVLPRRVGAGLWRFLYPGC
ncbi:MAG TPA: hypothetical protein VF797_03505 [Noviherbaspirillum sp.]